MTSPFIPDRVHLVGSIGIDTVQDVFSTVGRKLGKRIKRIPDGEPGGRRLWAAWQYPLLRATPYLRPDPSGEVRKNSRLPQLCLAEGVDPAELTFSELGYAREARASYLDFQNARAAGDINPVARFQVCLPTPVAVVYSFCTTRDLVPILDAYERAMMREVDAVCAGIPHRDLCVQFDICQEMILCDGQPQDEFPPIHAATEELVERIRRLAVRVPEAAELGFHLCYGDFGAKHFIEPIDAARLVDVANKLRSALPRRIDYFHMPVPLTRTDDDYFKPLKALNLDSATELYLGIIHAQDGVEGSKRRIATAAKYIDKFGIGTECGMARARKPDFVHKLLDLHVALTPEPE